MGYYCEANLRKWTHQKDASPVASTGHSEPRDSAENGRTPSSTSKLKEHINEQTSMKEYMKILGKIEVEMSHNS